MTVCGSFDLEDDDFFDDTFRNISDAELTSYAANVLSEKISTNPESDHPSTDTKFEKKIFQSVTCSSFVKPNLNSTKINSSPSLHENKQSSQIFEELNAEKAVSCPDNVVLGVKTVETEIINSRFTPGFTPKVKKRKFPGPAGVFSEKNEACFPLEESNHFVKKKIEAEIEVQDITNSQFSADDLLLSSWQNLQADVSSKSILSSAKYYSIRRVYSETSKKKLPKHIVVPVLCVLLKKFNQAESHSAFIDDTGEIPGKIDKQVLVKFEEYLKDGVALILKRVTFLCNVLLLTQQSIISIYLNDGTVKHVQEMDSVPCREEPLKLMSCQCSETPPAKAARNRASYLSVDSFAFPESHIHGTTDNSAGILSVPRIHQPMRKNCHYHGTGSSRFSKENILKSTSTVPLNNCLKFPSTSIASRSRMCSNVSAGPYGLSNSSASDFSQDCNENSNMKNQQDDSIKVSVTAHSSETNDVFGGSSDFDEFDALLGNLDEKSFLEEF